MINTNLQNKTQLKNLNHEKKNFTAYYADGRYYYGWTSYA